MKNTTLIQTLLFLSLSVLSASSHADWQCFAADKGGHNWMSTGSTQERADAVAMSFCQAYSPDSASCHIHDCASS